MSQTSTSISFLLGAGFSAPKGNPTGRTLNSLVLNSKNENIAFHTSGSLVINIDGTNPDLGSPVGPKAGENETELLSKKEETTGSSGRKSHRRQVRTREKRI